MIGEQTKDFVYCPEGKHHVPRDEMTTIATAHPSVWRRCCNSCKDRIIDLRKAAKAEQVSKGEKHVRMD